MENEVAGQTEVSEFSRRLFLSDAAKAATVICLSPNLLSCQVKSNGTASFSNGADAMEQALELMADLAPLSNHGPMAAEALVALGRSDKVVAFAEKYKKRFTPIYPAKHQAITQNNWREALGDGKRVADWTNFFDRELKQAGWKQVLEQWADTLAPGMAAAAAHGLIRTSHAVRSLSVKETELRRRELAEGLGYWAAYYQTLPERNNAKTEKLKPAQAVKLIPVLPTEQRSRNGSIMIGLKSLNDFSPFADTIDLVKTTGKPEQILSEVTKIFADVYMKNVTQGNFIALLHAVTGTTALRSFLPYLSPAATRKMLRYGWQTAAGLYSISSIGSTNRFPEEKEIKRDDLIDRAAASHEEHAIKFTEACLREYVLNPTPVYLLAANDALQRIQPIQI